MGQLKKVIVKITKRRFIQCGQIGKMYKNIQWLLKSILQGPDLRFYLNIGLNIQNMVPPNTDPSLSQLQSLLLVLWQAVRLCEISSRKQSPPLTTSGFSIFLFPALDSLGNSMSWEPWLQQSANHTEERIYPLDCLHSYWDTYKCFSNRAMVWWLLPFWLVTTEMLQDSE